jgi:hypothetical protein
MSPLRTLASTSSSRRSDRIGLLAAETRALQMSDTAITLYSGDVQGMARSRTTTNPSDHDEWTRTLDAGVHHGEGRAGFWEPL